MELVYTDLMEPIKPAAKGDYLYVPADLKEIFLLKTEEQTIHSLRL